MQRGHRQLIVCPKASPLAMRATDDEQEVMPLGTSGALRRRLREGQFDIGHAHDGKAQTISFLSSFGLPVRRNLFLAVKEALNNAAKHSQADELFLRIYRRGQKLLVAVEDNGHGFDPAQTGGERNGLANMWQRMAEIGGACEVLSQPGGGCLVVFTVPAPRARRGWFGRRPRAEEPPLRVRPSNSGRSQ
jgi:signal transduction histidine kinase